MCQMFESARIYTTLYNRICTDLHYFIKEQKSEVCFIDQRTKVVSTDPAEQK